MIPSDHEHVALPAKQVEDMVLDENVRMILDENEFNVLPLKRKWTKSLKDGHPQS